VELLRIDADKRKDAAERARLLNAADVAFLCLPDAAAREAVALVDQPAHLRHRRQHRAPHAGPGWAFGLPELAPGQRDALRAPSALPTRAATHGLHPALMRPLVDAGLRRATLPVRPRRSPATRAAARR
jgi:N-acetyl-gamma-glutamyl-phosphate reductase